MLVTLCLDPLGGGAGVLVDGQRVEPAPNLLALLPEGVKVSHAGPRHGRAHPLDVRRVGVLNVYCCGAGKFDSLVVRGVIVIPLAVFGGFLKNFFPVNPT